MLVVDIEKYWAVVASVILSECFEIPHLVFEERGDEKIINPPSHVTVSSTGLLIPKGIHISLVGI